MYWTVIKIDFDQWVRINEMSRDDQQFCQYILGLTHKYVDGYQPNLNLNLKS